MRKRTIIRTTLGDVIAALTDAFMPFVRQRSGLYVVVAYALNDVGSPVTATPEAITTKLLRSAAVAFLS